MKKLIYIVAAGMLFGACKQKVEDPGGTQVMKLAGEWWVRANNTGKYYKVSTYNTAANVADKMWIQDAYGATKFVANANTGAQTFDASGATNVAANAATVKTINVTNGKVISNGTKGVASNAVTDSIYMEVEYSNKPGVKTILSGYHRTAWTEDDH